MLIPFRKEHGEILFRWQSDPEYKKVFREYERYFTIDECENFQNVIGSEVLCFYKADAFVGFFILEDRGHGVIEMGYAIDPIFRCKKIGLEGMNECLEYLKNKRRARKAMASVLFSDERVRDLMIKYGFNEVCVLERHVFFEGDYCDIVLMEKFI